MLTDAELLRYSRHILLKGIDIEGQLRLKESKILIIGLGGLGSPVALYLAAAGIGEMHLADFDTIDTSNLQRQILHDSQSEGMLKAQSAKTRLAAINPLVKISVHEKKLDKQDLFTLVKGMDLVLDCTDNFTIRDQINAACIASKTAWISAAAIQLQGQLTLFDPSSDNSPCYRCLYGSENKNNSDCNQSGVLGPLVGVIGSLQAAEAIKKLTDLGSSLLGKLLLVDLYGYKFHEFKISRDPQCSACAKK